MTRLTDYPGISPRSDLDEKGYFEEAYDVGEGLVMRARFSPIHDQLYIEGQIPIDVAPNSVFVTISRSLVDAEGQVLYVSGRGLVRDATSHKTFTDSELFKDREGFPAMTIEQWLDCEAMRHADELVSAWKSLQAFSFLIVPPGRVPPPTGTVEEEPPAPAEEKRLPPEDDMHTARPMSSIPGDINNG